MHVCACVYRWQCLRRLALASQLTSPFVSPLPPLLPTPRQDERYMATSDLCEILKKHAASSAVASASHSASSPHGHSSSSSSSPIDAAAERRICTAVLKLLDDDSNDVQAIAVKTLGVLLGTVHEEQVVEIADRLGSLVLDASKSELRDVYAIGLRTLVKTVPPRMGDLVSSRLVGRLIDGIRHNGEEARPGTGSRANGNGNSKGNGNGNGAPTAPAADAKAAEDISLCCLDVISDLLARFGSTSVSISRQHEQILAISLSQLAADGHVVRKRAGTTIGALSSVLSDALLVRLVENLLSQIDLAEGVGRSGRRRTRAARGDAGGAAAAPGPGPRAADPRSLIRTMCTVSGVVGHRLGQEQIDRIVPIFLRFCDPDDAVTGDDADDGDDDDGEMEEDGGHGDDDDDDDEAAISLANELRESCFAGFESFVLRCPKEVEPHLAQIVHSALAYMRYDPNYSYGDEDGDEDEDEAGEGGGSDDDDDDDDFDDDDGDYDDYDDDDEDDDSSWKVRRSSIRALSAVVESTKHDPSTLWIDEYAWRRNRGKGITVAGALVNRTKEREENCRVDVIDCFARLLSATVQAARNGVVVLAPSSSSDSDAMDTSSAPLVIDLGSKYAPAIVAACEQQLSAKKGGERTKSSAMALLSTLSLSPGGVGDSAQISSIFRHLKPILSKGDEGGHPHRAGSKSLKLDALSLVRAMLTAGGEHDPAHLKAALLEALLPEICAAVQEDWYKVIAEALRVLAVIPPLFAMASADRAEMDQVAASLYASIEPRLAAHDLDQEIKECALKATASLLSNLHGSLEPKQSGRLLSLLLERLKNETTRIVGIKTLSSIAAAGDADQMKDCEALNLSPILADAVTELAALLRQQSRGVKQSSLEALDIVVRYHGGDASSALDAALFGSVLKELGEIIGDSDLHISHLSLRAAMSVLKVCPSCGPAIKAHVLPPALALSTSPLLQDQALDSLLCLFEQLVLSDSTDYNELLVSLKGRLSSGEKKQTIANLAKCIAVITAATSAANRDAVVADIIATLESADSDLQQTQLALLTSGDLGRLVDFSQMEGVVGRLQAIYLSSFDSFEEIKLAAAYALGRASAGAMEVFLPAILNALAESSEKKQYLLLSAVRELIHCHQLDESGDIGPSVPLILPHLLNHSADKEEGVRTMTAECLGSLSCLQPSELLPQLKELASKHSGKTLNEEASEDDKEGAKKDALHCWTVATSIKFAIAGSIDPDQLSPFLPTFLHLLKEDDTAVKNAALLMVYSAVHHKPQLVTGLMHEHILPSLYELAQLNMKRVVDLGPFKHTVDDALPLRKSALSIFSTCLEKCPTSLDIQAFVPVLCKAFADVEDVQLQAHQIAVSMCSRQPVPMLSSIESFVEPLEKTINKKKGQKTGTELERVNEWIKSALRVMVFLSRVDGAMSNTKFSDFVDRTRKATKNHQALEAIEGNR